MLISKFKCLAPSDSKKICQVSARLIKTYEIDKVLFINWQKFPEEFTRTHKMINFFGHKSISHKFAKILNVDQINYGTP